MTWCNAVKLIVFADDAKLFRHILRDSDNNCFLQLGIDSLKQ